VGLVYLRQDKISRDSFWQSERLLASQGSLSSMFKDAQDLCLHLYPEDGGKTFLSYFETYIYTGLHHVMQEKTAWY